MSELARLPGEKTGDYLGRFAAKLAEAALIARERGDEIYAIFFAMKASETLQLAKHLGFKPDARRALDGQTDPREPSPVDNGDSGE